ncbi:MAG: hypothetical protein A2W99_03130 [Bacteroidetes bacterium GWF2_33_16]|nr:MAG: hypothetical protein A2W99_03130 [Bacteroidetes bacterium GWF2_33_16]
MIPVFYLAAQDIETEKESVKKVIQSAYIDGLHNKGELIDVEKGFHPGFVLLGVKDNSLTQYPIYTWIESFNKRKKDDPTPIKPENKIVCEYLQIDITGNAAMAKIQLKRNNELIFTDYLLLYKFDDGWKIVSKTYFRH